ncbi:hypothetical protein WJX72_001614 [[Myrmecia] bisecta]|uniref:Uncharacterized protein n=1 Tax=[Myrmecia] bisecta TaxID=41462 RepID=A0AAW1QPA9_9CHLO
MIALSEAELLVYTRERMTHKQALKWTLEHAAALTSKGIALDWWLQVALPQATDQEGLMQRLLQRARRSPFVRKALTDALGNKTAEEVCTVQTSLNSLDDLPDAATAKWRLLALELKANVYTIDLGSGAVHSFYPTDGILTVRVPGQRGQNIGSAGYQCFLWDVLDEAMRPGSAAPRAVSRTARTAASGLAGDQPSDEEDEDDAVSPARKRGGGARLTAPNINSLARDVVIPDPDAPRSKPRHGSFRPPTRVPAMCAATSDSNADTLTGIRAAGSGGDEGDPDIAEPLGWRAMREMCREAAQLPSDSPDSEEYARIFCEQIGLDCDEVAREDRNPKFKADVKLPRRMKLLFKDVSHAREGTIKAYWPKLCLLREWLQVQYALGKLDSPLITADAFLNYLEVLEHDKHLQRRAADLLGEDDDIIEEGARALAEDWMDLDEPTNSALLGSMGKSTVKQWACAARYLQDLQHHVKFGVMTSLDLTQVKMIKKELRMRRAAENARKEAGLVDAAAGEVRIINAEQNLAIADHFMGGKRASSHTVGLRTGAMYFCQCGNKGRGEDMRRKKEKQLRMMDYAPARDGGLGPTASSVQGMEATYFTMTAGKTAQGDNKEIQLNVCHRNVFFCPPTWLSMWSVWKVYHLRFGTPNPLDGKDAWYHRFVFCSTSDVLKGISPKSHGDGYAGAFDAAGMHRNGKKTHLPRISKAAEGRINDVALEEITAEVKWDKTVKYTQYMCFPSKTCVANQADFDNPREHMIERLILSAHELAEFQPMTQALFADAEATLRRMQASNRVAATSDLDTAAEHVLNVYIHRIRKYFFQSGPFFYQRWPDHPIWDIAPLRPFRKDGTWDRWCQVQLAFCETFRAGWEARLHPGYANGYGLLSPLVVSNQLHLRLMDFRSGKRDNVFDPKDKMDQLLGVPALQAIVKDAAAMLINLAGSAAPTPGAVAEPSSSLLSPATAHNVELARQIPHARPLADLLESLHVKQNLLLRQQEANSRYVVDSHQQLGSGLAGLAAEDASGSAQPEVPVPGARGVLKWHKWGGRYATLTDYQRGSLCGLREFFDDCDVGILVELDSGTCARTLSMHELERRSKTGPKPRLVWRADGRYLKPTTTARKPQLKGGEGVDVPDDSEDELEEANQAARHVQSPAREPARPVLTVYEEKRNANVARNQERMAAALRAAEVLSAGLPNVNEDDAPTEEAGKNKRKRKPKANNENAPFIPPRLTRGAQQAAAQEAAAQQAAAQADASQAQA